MRSGDGNRRAQERFAVQLPCRFSSESMEFDAEAEVCRGEVSDVSAGGVFVRCDLLEVPGTPVHLLIFVPESDKAIPVDGRVAWISVEAPKGPGMGIRLSSELLGAIPACILRGPRS